IRWSQRNAEAACRVHKSLRSDANAELREVGITRMDQTVVHIDDAVRMRIQHVVPYRSPARYSGADPAVRQARAEERRAAQAHIATQRGCRGHEFEGGSRRVKPV